MKSAKEEARKLAAYVIAMTFLPPDIPIEILEMCADALMAQRFRVKMALGHK